MNKLGFGFLRLPKTADGEIDHAALCGMVDAFLAGGGRYFDTAYSYLDGKSETALRETLVKRHPRDSFILADKLPGWAAKSEADNEKFFAEQLERCGVDYFDVFLLHWLNPKNFEIAENCRQFEFLYKLKREGRAKKIGFSYHGDSALLARILAKYPGLDIVQLQINYLDWDDPAIDARRCYEVAASYGAEVVVMEPIKGGTLAALPAEAEALLRARAPERSPSDWALAFAGSLDAVSVVLSGMNAPEQIEQNLRERAPLDAADRAVLADVCTILNASIAVPCTACRYCVSHCPQGIAIPDFFSIFNSYARHPDDDWKMKPIYREIASKHAPASACIACGTCERHCPQGIDIIARLEKVAEVFG